MTKHKASNIINTTEKYKEKTLYEAKQNGQNQQIDTNAKKIITEIRTSFLKVFEILKTYYYKLKNTAKEYIKKISIDKNVQI